MSAPPSRSFFATDSAAAIQGDRAVLAVRRHRLCYRRVCRIPHNAGCSCFCAIAWRIAFLTAIIAWLWLGQRPLRKRHIALVIVFAGIVLIAIDSFSRGPKLTHTQILGDLLLLCGSSSWAVFTLLLSRYPIRPLAATVATTLGSAVVYLPIWWLFLPSTLGQAPVNEIAVQAIYQGVVVVFLAMLLFTFAVSRLGSQTVALLMAFVPVVSALAAVPILGEPLSLLTLSGLAAVTAGAILGARENQETEPGLECK